MLEICIVLRGSAAPSVPWSLPCQGFMITLRHTTHGRTPLDEWSAWRRGLWKSTILTGEKHPCRSRDSNPQSQQASGRGRTPWTEYIGVFKMIVWVLTTCHTQYTSDSSICFSLFNRTTLQVFVTYRTGALYAHYLWFYKHQHDNPVRSKLSVACQRWWFQWRFW